jgi:hypothetical protein
LREAHSAGLRLAIKSRIEDWIPPSTTLNPKMLFPVC